MASGVAALAVAAPNKDKARTSVRVAVMAVRSPGIEEGTSAAGTEGQRAGECCGATGKKSRGANNATPILRPMRGRRRFLRLLAGIAAGPTAFSLHAARPR